MKPSAIIAMFCAFVFLTAPAFASGYSGGGGPPVPVSVLNGGTASTTAPGARTNLGAAASGANSDVTSLSALSTPLSVLQGGTGSTTNAGTAYALKGANTDITSFATTAASTMAATTTTVPLSINGVSGQTSNLLNLTSFGAAAGNILKANASTGTITGFGDFISSVGGFRNGTGSFVATSTGHLTLGTGLNATIGLTIADGALARTADFISVTSNSGSAGDRLKLTAAGLLTVPTLSTTSISGLTTPLSVAQGGTGAATLGDAGVVIGNGTGAVNVTSAGTTGQVLTSNGAGVDPTFQAAAAVGGVLTVSGGATTLTASSPETIVIPSPGSTVTLTFPLASSCPGKRLRITTTQGSFQVKVTPNAADTICANASAAQPLLFTNGCAEFVSDGGTNWHMVAVLNDTVFGVKFSTADTILTVGDGSGCSGKSLATILSAGPDVTVAQGGTGSSTASGARTNLEVNVFSSTTQTITAAGALTLAHSLGRTPKEVWASLVNVTGELGYTTGQEVFVSGHQVTTIAGNTNGGYATIVDGTNLTVRFGSDANTFAIPHATTGVATNIINANWTINFYAR